MKSVGIYTLGCKVNTYESEFVANELKKAQKCAYLCIKLKRIKKSRLRFKRL